MTLADLALVWLWLGLLFGSSVILSVIYPWIVKGYRAVRAWCSAVLDRAAAQMR